MAKIRLQRELHLPALVDRVGDLSERGQGQLHTEAPQTAPKPRAIIPQLADLIERLKHENPHRTGTTLLRELVFSQSLERRGSG